MARTRSTATPRPLRALGVLVALLAILVAYNAASGSWNPRLGLDLRGGTSITLTAQTTDGSAVTRESLLQALSIIEQRVNSSGTTEPDISTQGSNNIIVQVPGVGEEELIKLIGQTAELRFRPVITVIDGGRPQPEPEPSAAPTPSPTASPSGVDPNGTISSPSPTPAGRALTPDVAAAATPSADGAGGSGATSGESTPTPAPGAIQPEGSGDAPSDEQIAALTSLDCSQLRGGVDDAKKPLVTCDVEGTQRFLLGPADVVGQDLADATAGFPPNSVKWQVNLEFTSSGGDKFYDSTVELSQKSPPQNSFAIVLDGRVFSYPRVSSPIAGGRAEITGEFTQQEARDLANVLKYGALPLTFTTSEVTSVTPQLGEEQLRGGIVAGLIGLGLVVIYSLLFYRALGIVSILSLTVAGAITFMSVVALGQLIGFTLILAGVIGVIVSIGITADSFVVFFERVRDEIREGRSIRMAVELGWARAQRTILVADGVTFLAALVLYFLAIGRVQNFAFTLGLTTLIDVVVVYLFTKPIVTLLVRRRFFGQGHAASGLNPQRIGRVTAGAPLHSGASMPGISTQEAK